MPYSPLLAKTLALSQAMALEEGKSLTQIKFLEARRVFSFPEAETEAVLSQTRKYKKVFVCFVVIILGGVLVLVLTRRHSLKLGPATP
jgi:hypothetical protein